MKFFIFLGMVKYLKCLAQEVIFQAVYKNRYERVVLVFDVVMVVYHHFHPVQSVADPFEIVDELMNVAKLKMSKLVKFTEKIEKDFVTMILHWKLNNLSNLLDFNFLRSRII